jgi:hypothetical protein
MVASSQISPPGMALHGVIVDLDFCAFEIHVVIVD